jgi:hypothetical protein
MFRGTAASRPVEGLTKESGLKVAGLVKLTKKGDDIECTETSVCVPPKAVTTYCFPRDEGAMSAAMVYVGDVRPVTVAPVTGVVGAKLIGISHEWCYDGV